MPRSSALLGVLLAIVGLTGRSSGPRKRRLVEQGTDRPIEGAVVLAYWFGTAGTLVTSHGVGEFWGAHHRRG
jgi:hypothetical protein